MAAVGGEPPTMVDIVSISPPASPSSAAASGGVLGKRPGSHLTQPSLQKRPKTSHSVDVGASAAGSAGVRREIDAYLHHTRDVADRSNIRDFIERKPRKPACARVSTAKLERATQLKRIVEAGQSSNLVHTLRKQVLEEKAKRSTASGAPLDEHVEERLVLLEGYLQVPTARPTQADVYERLAAIEKHVVLLESRLGKPIGSHEHAIYQCYQRLGIPATMLKPPEDATAFDSTSQRTAVAPPTAVSGAAAAAAPVSVSGPGIGRGVGGDGVASAAETSVHARSPAAGSAVADIAESRS